MAVERVKPRVLVTCYPQSGHLHPLTPVLQALAVAGCPLLVATSGSQRAALASLGLDSVDLGPSADEASRELAKVAPAIRAAAPRNRRALGFSFLFGTVYAAAIADGLFEHARAWGADAVLASLESLAGPLVAARIGKPLVVNGFGIGLGEDVGQAAARAVAPLWERAGLPVPVMAGTLDGLYLDPCPPSLHPKDVPLAWHRLAIRPAEFDGAGDLPALPARRPLVYVTLGTNPAYATPERLHRIAEAVADAGAGAVITGIDPPALGVLPEGIVAHRFVPQSLILPHCEAVVCHAGASTLFGTLKVGLPLVLMPLGADHFANAHAAVQRGVAVAVDEAADSSRIAGGLRRVLEDQAFRSSAAELAREIAAMPSATAVVERVLAWLAAR